MTRLPLDLIDEDDLNGDRGPGLGHGPAQVNLHPFDEIRGGAPTWDHSDQ